MIKRKLRKLYPDFNYKHLNHFLSSYVQNYYKSLQSKKNKPSRLLGYNGIKLLLTCHQRSKLLFLGTIDCINSTNLAVAFLSVRAHFETTGSVAYFFYYLRSFYNNNISYKELEEILFKLSLAGKTFPDKTRVPERPDPINVLTQIDKADKLFSELPNKNSFKTPFRDCYDFLSEFCHPNLLGLIIGSDIIRPGTIEFYAKPNVKKQDLGILLNYLSSSCTFFFYVYNKAFNLIKEHEEIPILSK